MLRVPGKKYYLFCKKSNYKKGFTLAEILLSLTIIGIISILTIIPLLVNLQNAQYKIALKQVNSDLAGAVRRFTTDNSGSLAGAFANSTDFKNKLAAKLNVAKDCNGIGLGNCWTASSSVFMNKTTDITTSWQTFSSGSDPTVVLSNGSSIHIDYGNNATYGTSSCNSNWGGQSLISDVCLSIDVDTNGIKGPNILGYDTFSFFVKKDGTLVPYGASSTSYSPSTDCISSGSGLGCTASYIMGN